MALASTTAADEVFRTRIPSGNLTDTTRSLNSAVSWGAIAAGAAAAASLSLILLILGVGLGLSSVSPWTHDGISAASFGVSTIVWLTLTQLLASGMGGYLAGRLRTKWTELHRDEVYFRDTAHGFLAWAVASLATAALLTSVIGSILGSGVQAGASVLGGTASIASAAAGGATASAGMGQGNETGPMGYFVDSLFRRDAAAIAAAEPGAATGSPATGVDGMERNAGQNTVEVTRIFLSNNLAAPLPPEDLRYLGHIVAQRTGLSQQEGEKRVNEVYAKAQAQVHNAELAAREAADKARKTSAFSALWLFVSLLTGAFVASLAATYGGRQRDA
jgi:hypothetical protein